MSNNGKKYPTIEDVDPRDKRILEMSSAGLTNRQIAKELNYEEDYIKQVRHKLFEKLGADNIAHAVAIALRKKLIE